MIEEGQEYVLSCPDCMCEFDALQAAWCSCDAHRPTKLCPYCLSCLCKFSALRDRFWAEAPPALHKEQDILKDSRMLFGDILVRAGVITVEQLVAGLRHQKKTGQRLGDALVSLGFLGRDTLESFLQLQKTVVTFDLKGVVLDLGLVQALGVDFCRLKRVLPLERESFQGRTLLTVVMADPADTEIIDTVEGKTGCHVVVGRAPEEKILAVLDAQCPG
jgi:hypothetical protein